MANGRVTQIRGGVTTATPTNGHVTLVRGRGGGACGFVTYVRGRSAPNLAGLVTRVRGKATTPDIVVVDAGPNLTSDPLKVVEINATGTLTTWTITQTAGPTVTITGSAGAWEYRTPATLGGTVCTFRVSGTTDDGSTGADTVSHTIRGHGGIWTPNGGSNIRGRGFTRNSDL